MIEDYRLIDEPARRVCVLDNGMTVILARHAAGPMAAVRMYVRGGSAFEGSLTGSGVSHLIEHVVTGDGTQRRTEEDIAEVSEAIGGLLNAYTGEDHICYHTTVLRHHVATAVELLADWIVRPLLSAEIFEREHGVVQRELERDRDEPNMQLEEMLHDAAYPGSSMRFPVIGRRDTLLKLTHGDLVAHHRRTHVPDNVIAVVVGDIELDAAMKTILAVFDGFGRTVAADMTPIEPPPFAGPRRAVKVMKVHSTTLSLAWRTIREATPDEATLNLLMSILTEGNDARLVKELLWDRSLVHAIAGSHDCGWHGPGLFELTANLDVDKIDTVEQAVLAQLDRLETHPVTDAELRMAKRRALMSVQLARQTADGLAAQFGEDWLATGDVNYTDSYIQKIEAATGQDLLRAVRQYLRPEARVVAVVVPESVRTMVGVSQTAAVGPSFQRHTLDNGLTCPTAPMPGNPFVAIQISFPGGLRVEHTGNNGIFNLLAELWQRGTKTRDADAIAAFFGNCGSHLQTGSGLDGIWCGCLLAKEDAPAALEVLADVIARPALAETELAKIVPSVCDAIRRIDEDWLPELVRFARSQFFAHSPYRMGRLGTVESVERVTVQDIRKIQEAYVQPPAGVIALSGGLDSAVQDAVARHFGSLANMTARPPMNAPPREPALTKDRLFIKPAHADREVAGVFVGYSGHRAADREHRAALTVLGAMLAGYGLPGGRLYWALRGGDRDLVYEVSDASFAGELPGWFGITAATHPDSVNEVCEIILEEMGAMRGGEFDDEEIERAKTMVLTGEWDHLQTPGDFARRICVDEMLGLGMEDWRVFLEEIKLVGRDRLLRSAQAHLRFAMIAVLTPKPDSVRILRVAEAS